MPGMRQILLAVALVLVVPARAQDDFRSEVLAAHNAERAKAGLPPLVWDPVLAGQAGGWARRLAGLGHLRHAMQMGEGENLWMGSQDQYSVTDMVADWIGEKAQYRRGTYPHVSTTGNWEDVGHYTQIMWRQTEKLGCGLDTGNGHDFLVCRYFPPGNVIGEEAF